MNFNYVIRFKFKLLMIIIFVIIFSLFSNLYSQNSWTRKADFAGSFRLNPVSFSIGEKGYLSTGGSFGIGQFELDLWEFDPHTNIWTQKADLGTIGRINSVGFVINGKAYVGLGQVNVMLQDFWEYNPQTNLWTQLNNFPGNARIDATSFVIDDYGYIGCGFDGANHLNDFWKYNPKNDSWTQVESLPAAVRLAPFGFSLQSKGYCGGGINTNTWVSSIDFWEYNPVLNSWLQKQDLPFTYAWGSELVIYNKAYVGISFGSTIYEYDPSIDSWTQKADLTNLYRTYGIGFSIGNKGYMGLGSDNGPTYYYDFWEYTPGTTPSVNTYTSIANYDTKAVVKGKVIFDGNYEITKRGFVWSTSSNPTLLSYPNGNYSISYLNNDDIYIDTIAGLEENTKYYFRAYATNNQGTSYGDVYELTTKFTTNTDGNQDGIPDSLQSYVNTFTDNKGNLITLVDLNNNPIYDIEIITPNDTKYYYPFDLIKFKINAQHTKVRLLFHGISNLDTYIYRKLDNNNQIRNYKNVVFSKIQILDNEVAYVDIELFDGEFGDYDGIANGIIVDPGGPAILASNIPTLSDWARGLLVILVVGFGIYRFKRNFI